MNSKEILADVLERKMENESLDCIKVIDVIREAGVSKPTFYRYFNDKYELLEYCFRRIYNDTFGRISRYYPFSEACKDVYRLYREKQGFLRCGYLSKDVNGLTSLEIRLVRETYSHYLEDLGLADKGEVTFSLDLFSTGAVEMTKRWVLDGMHRSDEEQTRLLIRALPNNIAQYFR